jgi:metacaspase-1
MDCIGILDINTYRNMNVTKFIVFVFCALSFGVSRSQSNLPVKHSLVVAISNYSPNSGFRHIDADNDLMIINRLLRQQGFTDTIILKDEQATKAAFNQSFKKLLSNVHTGDIVYIHFSTHGQQLQDLNGDETDGLDEAIALYDAQTSSNNDYKGQNHLTDDEFGVMIEDLRKNLGKDGDILVMIDACHSGSMSRGLDTAIIRGGYPPIMFDSEKPEIKTRGDNVPLHNTTTHKIGIQSNKNVGMFSPVNRDKGDNLANYTVFSACENDEVSSEYYYNHRYFGPLTWAFLTALLNNNTDNFTYTKLFHDVQYEMISMFENYKTKQSPTMESAETRGADKIIFGGKAVAQQHFYPVEKFLAADKLIIGGGNISGIFDSTTVVVYPSGTIDPGKAGTPIARGIIIHSGYMESTVQLNSSLKPDRPGDYWVFISDRKLSGYRVRLKLGSFTDADLKRQAIAALKNCRYVEICTDTPSYILEQKKDTKNEMVLEHGMSRKIYKQNILPGNLGTTLLNLAQVRFLKELQASEPDIAMDISFLPSDTVRFPKSKFIDPKTQRTTFREKSDTAILCIVNTGRKSFYFNIIDIDPQDNFTVILPSNERAVSECFLRPGQKFLARNTFGKPYGTELLKIVASEKKFDLRPVINNMGDSRGALGDLEQLFSTAYQMRGTPTMPESADIATFNFFFDIIKQ